MTRTALFSFFTAILVLSFVVFTNMAFAAKDKAPAQKTPTVITEDNMAEHIFSKDYKDWRLVCNKAETQCRIFQRLSLQKDEQLQTLLTASLGAVKDKKGIVLTDMRLTSPIGVVLPLGMVFKVDEGEEVNVNYHVCTPEGCLAEFVLSDDGLKQLKKGTTMSVAYQIAGLPKPVNVGLSLKGFTKAHKELIKRTAK